jgi:hypothetical protein
LRGWSIVKRKVVDPAGHRYGSMYSAARTENTDLPLTFREWQQKQQRLGMGNKRTLQVAGEFYL